MRRITWVMGALMFGCGGGDAGPAPDAGSSTVYQNARGFCADNPRLTGGDLVGTWTVVGACAISTNSPANCASSTVSLSFAVDGTVTFNADQTGAMDVTVTLGKDSTVPLSCPSAGDCASLQSTLAIEVGADAGARAVCSVSSAEPTLCSCEQDFSPRLYQGAGGYELRLPHYLVSPALGLQGGFLVQGNTLRLSGVTVDGTQLDLIAQR